MSSIGSNAPTCPPSRPRTSAPNALVASTNVQMREPSISNVERQFALQCITSGRRLDGRSPTDARRVSVSLGPDYGFAQVSLDNTLAVATTTVDAIIPGPDRPSEGTLSITVNLSATSSERAARESMHRSSATLAAELRNCVDRFVRESRAIDTEALCILAARKVWSVRVDVDVVNDDGNCVDACVMAVVASLLHARRPDVTVTGSEVRIHSLDEREPVPLPVHHVPLAVTFALFGAGKPYEDDAVALDPVRGEELASNGSLSFAFNAQGEVCGVYKAGGLPLSKQVFSTCAQLGVKRACELTAVLKQALADAAAQHPLATVRPLLVNPEPKAQLNSVGERKKVVTPTAAMWNAAPADDVAPPKLSRERETPDVMEDAQGAATEADEKKKIVEQLLVSDSSSDEDLADAVLAKPRGGGARPTKKR